MRQIRDLINLLTASLLIEVVLETEIDFFPDVEYPTQMILLLEDPPAINNWMIRC